LPAAVAAIAGVERQGILTVLLSNGRRVEVDRGFDPGDAGATSNCS
jgi:hypothetical protein